MAQSGGDRTTAPRGEAPRPVAASHRDPVLGSFFPAVVVCDEEGGLLDADEAAADLLPCGDEREALLRDLVRPALEALAADSGRPSVTVGSEAASIEGIATMAQAGGRSVVVVHLRDPRESPAVQALARQNRIYEAVLTTGPIFVHVYDRQMNSRWATSALRPELGFQPTRLLTAEENYAFVHPDDIPSERPPQAAIEAEPGGATRRIRVRNADGDWRWLAIISVDLLDDPEVGSIVVHSWDVTDEVEREQEIEDARRRMAALIDTLEEAVVVVADDQVTYANTRVGEMFPGAGTVEDLIGSPVSELGVRFAAAMADPKAFAASCVEIAAAGKTMTGRMVETADGRTLEQNFLAIRDGDRESSRVWVHRDITAQLQLRRRQERLLELERETRRDAEEQARRLQELDALKTEFVASVSHELRTPLSAISSYVELLLDPDGSALSQEQRGIAESIERGSNRLTRLVDDLLELARLQSGAIAVERAEMSVPGAVHEAIEEIRRAGPLGKKELLVDVGEGPPIESDSGRVIQILANLLGNAAKFAALRVRCTAHSTDGFWVIEIADDGPGIPVDQLDAVFEPFYRVASPPTDIAGSGLGLAISSRLAEALGGGLTLSNAADGGAQARLILPVETPAEIAR